MENQKQTLKMSKKILKALKRVKRHTPGAGFFIDDAIERIKAASQKTDALSEFCTILMTFTMMLGMQGMRSSDFDLLQSLNKECAVLLER